MATNEEMQAYLKVLPGNVAKDVEVMDYAVTGQALLHLSRDPKIKRFVPSVTNRTGHGENRSVARVSTAPTILGCFVGYCAADSDFNWPETDSGMVQGWTLYSLPYKLALRPNKRALFDQKNSDEHWLVTFSEDTREYIPVKVAKCFYRDMTSVSRPGKRPIRTMTLMVEVFDEPLVFSKRFTLTKGYWEIKGPEPSEFVESWKDDAQYTVRSISKGDYTGVKNLSVDMQARPLPTSFNW